MLKGLVIGVLLGILTIAGGVYFYFSTGRAPVAVTDPPMPFEKKFTQIALHAYLGKQQHPEPPVPADETNYRAGAQVYKENCAACHGLPGQPKTTIAQGMYPPPPQLFHGVGVSDDAAWESYWKVESGIRMTGMPEFKGRLTETQIWQVTVLLANSDKIPDSVKAALTSTPAAPENAPAKANGPAKR